MAQAKRNSKPQLRILVIVESGIKNMYPGEKPVPPCKGKCVIQMFLFVLFLFIVCLQSKKMLTCGTVS